MPKPAPALETVKVPVGVGAGGGADTVLNVEVTDLTPSIITVQVVPLVLLQPLQPAKVEPVNGVAVRVTGLPELYE